MKQILKIEHIFGKTSGALAAASRKTALVIIAIFTVAAAASAASMPLSLQDAPLSIAHNSSVTKKINGIPHAVAGTIRFNIKWHTVALLPTYNRLRLELRHGTTTMKTVECFSTHSNIPPKCSFNFVITSAESQKLLNWQLRVYNSSPLNVNGFNIQKEITDLNPLVPNLKSTFEPSCASMNLEMYGSSGIVINAFSNSEARIDIKSALAGVINLKAKWHTPSFPLVKEAVAPSYWNLKISLLNESGALVQESMCFSFHSPQTPRCDFSANVPAGTDVRQWKIRVENKYGVDLQSFDIKKGGDILVPYFVSTFKPKCD